MERRRRIGAYGVCRDDAGRVLLVRASEQASVNGGRWLLPGGGVEHGEHPERAVIRELAEETGLIVEVLGLREVVSDIDMINADGPTAPNGVPTVPGGLLALRHHDRLIYDVRAIGGSLTPELGGSSSDVGWFTPAELPEIELTVHTARVLGVPMTAAVLSEHDHARRTLAEVPVTPIAGVPAHRQRFAAYGLVTDPAGDVLLTLISPGYPGAGHWHLPGGGIDFGEEAATGLLREVVEETNQLAEITGLLGASHRRHGAALGPEGVPIDFHGVRVVFRAQVTAPSQPRVTEDAGSTVAAAWYPPAQALQLPLTEIARECIGALLTAEPVT